MAEGGLCFDGLGWVQVLLRELWSTLFSQGEGLGWLQVDSTSRPGARSAEGGLYFDGLGHHQASSAWLGARELCFRLCFKDFILGQEEKHIFL